VLFRSPRNQPDVPLTTERYGLLKFREQDVTIVGEDIKPGDTASEFIVQTQDWVSFKGLEKTAGKVRIIATVPSLDTDVCDRETRRFNEEATALGNDIAIMIISTDLPFAQKRWCGAAGIKQVTALSDHMEVDFGVKYGCLIKEIRLLRRAVFVIDRNGKVVYAAYMPTLGVEPDYGEVLAAAKAALV